MNTITKSIIAGLFALSALGAHAQVILTYTGANFTSFDPGGTVPIPQEHTTADRVSGTITLADYLDPNMDRIKVTPLSFVFTDGVSTLTDANVSESSFRFTTDAFGTITEWSIRATFSDTDGGGPRQTIEATLNDEGPEDFGLDALCGPSSTADGCDNFGTPYYRTSASTSAAAGLWQISGEPLSPDAGALPVPLDQVTLPIAALVALVGLMASRRRQ
ncbi:hypothetical protein EY643_01440 [Halioglobus maricola]|uniref:PEP-CTERM sorting domain-containing protein n=1 Tax=Halioglobus maricola TaxID=2601894 RepID=A0A5P9NF73_9GAMM|nr:hypothetical protein [Halioglobus maricola]QFU74421.1 hypothetical protein EY643_01440 [Halioglobus maricola]